ncbi:unnamed protein product [Ectocarpus fasciculatus]
MLMEVAPGAGSRGQTTTAEQVNNCCTCMHHHWWNTHTREDNEHAEEKTEGPFFLFGVETLIQRGARVCVWERSHSYVYGHEIHANSPRKLCGMRQYRKTATTYNRGVDEMDPASQYIAPLAGITV